jgi:hypothetical protein
MHGTTPQQIKRIFIQVDTGEFYDKLWSYVNSGYNRTKIKDNLPEYIHLLLCLCHQIFGRKIGKKITFNVQHHPHTSAELLRKVSLFPSYTVLQFRKSIESQYPI